MPHGLIRVSFSRSKRHISYRRHKLWSDINPFNSTDQKKKFANSVDPDHTAHLIMIYTACLFLFCHYSFAILYLIFVYATSLIQIIVIFNLMDGRFHFRNSGAKGLEITELLDLKILWILQMKATIAVKEKKKKKKKTCRN